MHIELREIPESRVCVGIESGVVATVSVTADSSKPDIVTRIRQNVP